MAHHSRRAPRTTVQTLALALILVVFAAAACGDEAAESTSRTTSPTTSTDTPTEDDPTTTVATTAATTPTATSTDGESLLIGCETEIAADVPIFYATYFRCQDIAVDGDSIVITSVNEPPHLSGYYDPSDPRYEEFDTTGGRHKNPNTIAGETVTVRIPIEPEEQGTIVDARTVNAGVGDDTDYPFGTAGIALDGVAYFNPLAAPGDDIENEVFTFDSLSGHPQQQGGYHYHGTSVGPLRVLLDEGLTTTDQVGEAEIELYGIMCDGTVLMGMTELDGSSPADDLDLQNGHVHDIVDSSGRVMLENRYHVHMAAELSLDPRGLTPEAQWYSTCEIN